MSKRPLHAIVFVLGAALVAALFAPRAEPVSHLPTTTRLVAAPFADDRIEVARASRSAVRADPAPAPPVPASAPPTTVVAAHSGARQPAATSRGTASTHTSSSWAVLWPRIAGCESNGNRNGPIIWAAVNRHGSTASGGFEDLDSTWGGYGGYARAMYAPPAVQLAMNEALFNAAGTSPWDSSRRCWA